MGSPHTFLFISYTHIPNTDSDGPKTGCSFKFYGQLSPSNVPQYLLKELEDEIDNPTGITTIRAPEMRLKGVLVSKNCGIIYDIPELKGLKSVNVRTNSPSYSPLCRSQGLFHKITICTYTVHLTEPLYLIQSLAVGGISTLVNAILLWLLVRQAARSRSASGLSRVSRYPFVIQSLIDAVSFAGVRTTFSFSSRLVYQPFVACDTSYSCRRTYIYHHVSSSWTCMHPLRL